MSLVRLGGRDPAFISVDCFIKGVELLSDGKMLDMSLDQNWMRVHG